MPSLTELEENLLSGGESRSEAIAIMKDVGEDIEKCKSQLLDLKKQVKKFQGICKATTAFGTAMNVTGAALTTAGIAGAPFTAGASLPLAGIGYAFGAGGTGVKIAAKRINSKVSKDYILKMQSLLSDCQSKIEKLNESTEGYDKAVKYLRESFDMDDEAALAITNRFWATFDSTTIGENVKQDVEKMGGIGILVVSLAVVKPCSAKVGPVAPLTLKLVRKEVSQLANHLTEVMATTTVREETEKESALQVGARSTQPVTTEMAMHYFRELELDEVWQQMASAINLGHAIFDVVSLVKSWEGEHVVVEAIEEVICKLVEVQAAVEAQMKTLVDCRYQTETRTCRTSRNDFSDKIRVYDISPQFLKIVLRTASIIVPDGGHDTLSTAQLVRKMNDLTGKMNDATFGLSDCFSLLDVLQELVSSRGFEFQTEANDPSTISLTSSDTQRILFDGDMRIYLREILFPIHEILRKRLDRAPNICCIYRFRCIRCLIESKEFNYIGQARDFGRPYQQHTDGMVQDWMDHEDFLASLLEGRTDFEGRLPRSILYEHFNANHSDGSRFSDVFKVDIVHQLPENGQTGEGDLRVRRSWEMFYQWLFLDWTSEGGESPR